MEWSQSHLGLSPAPRRRQPGRRKQQILKPCRSRGCTATPLTGSSIVPPRPAVTAKVAVATADALESSTGSLCSTRKGTNASAKGAHSRQTNHTITTTLYCSLSLISIKELHPPDWKGTQDGTAAIQSRHCALRLPHTHGGDHFSSIQLATVLPY